MNVTVFDENDNEPIFDPDLQTSFEILEFDGSFTTTIVATDADSGPWNNFHLNYYYWIDF